MAATAVQAQGPQNRVVIVGSQSGKVYISPKLAPKDFAIYESGSGSVLRMFSLSRIHGALGDRGQSLACQAKLQTLQETRKNLEP